MATEATEGAHGAAEAAHGAADAAHAAGSAGMPQLDFSTYPNQIFWLAVTIVVIYLILSRVALPRISGVLADRKSTITNDLAAAEDLKLQAQKAEEAYDQALADAKAEAARIVAEARAEIQGEVDKAAAKADAEIAAKAAESEKRISEIRDGARESVLAVAKEAAGEIVSAFGQNADATSIATAVEGRVKG